MLHLKLRYIGSSFDDYYLRIFMELVSGDTIYDFIVRFGALSEQICQKYIRQITEALVYLENKNIVHR